VPNKVLEELATTARKQWRRLRRAGDIEAALAVFERLPPALRERADILHERAQLVHLTGRLHAASDAYRKALAANPADKASWQALCTILRDLGRTDEFREILEEMISVLPAEFETLVENAQIARAGKLSRLADNLFDQAISARATASAAAIVKAARILLKQGDQGRVINLLKNVSIQPDTSLQNHALELNTLAFAQLRLAGRSNASSSRFDPFLRKLISLPWSLLDRRDVESPLSSVLWEQAALKSRSSSSCVRSASCLARSLDRCSCF
jgi:tetratricopeptide (TPR) repeat protein